jgi:hypothetical protein
VLVLVVSVAASGAFLRIVSVQRSWKNAYKSQVDKADVAVLTSANDKIALGQVVAQLKTAKDACADIQKALDEEKVVHAADKAASAQATAVLQGQFDSLNASLTALQTDLASAQALLKQFSDEKVALAKAVETANEAARGLKKDFDEASVQIRRLDTMAKHYALLIKDLRAEKQELQMELDKGPTLAATGGTPAPVTAPGQAISGKITAVQNDTGVASINVGRARGIQEKMVLKIFRGGKFVAHLRIDLIEPDSAAGVILDKKMAVQQGDEVATDLK